LGSALLGEVNTWGRNHLVKVMLDWRRLGLILSLIRGFLSLSGKTMLNWISLGWWGRFDIIRAALIVEAGLAYKRLCMLREGL
jgi:hypothetical protein